MGRRSESGGVRPHANGNRIEVELVLQGKRIKPTLDLKPTATNLKAARKLRAGMLDEIKAGTFNLQRHFPDYRFAEAHQAADEAQGRTFKEWADLWAGFAARELEHSTLVIYRRHLDRNWIAEFGGMLPKQITHERVLRHLSKLGSERLDPKTGKTLKPLSRKTQNNLLIPFRAVWDLICKAPGAPANPTDGIENLKTEGGEPDPFEPEELELALDWIRKHRSAAAADYFEFAAFAGLRTSEHIALLWEDVDLRKNEITVRRTKVLKEEKERTKTHKRRVVELNDRARAVIDRQRARTFMLKAEVFRNPATGRTWNDEQEQRRIWKEALRALGIRHRPPKELRDTSVTLALMAGCDPYYVAAQHGHSVTTMQKDYARWIPKADRGRNLAAMNAALGQGAPTKKVDADE